jgi:hypothetical protein
MADYDLAMTAARHIALSPKAICQEVNGEMVILDMRSEQYFSLNEVGSKLWRLLESDNNLSLAIIALLDQYEVEGDQLRSDVEHLVAELISAGLASESQVVQ